MAKVLAIVDVRRRAALYETLTKQGPERARFGETGCRLYVDDNARHIGYVMLDWQSLESAHAFLESFESKKLFEAWPVEKVISLVPLSDIGLLLQEIEKDKQGSADES